MRRLDNFEIQKVNGGFILAPIAGVITGYVSRKETDSPGVVLGLGAIAGAGINFITSLTFPTLGGLITMELGAVVGALGGGVGAAAGALLCEYVNYPSEFKIS